MQTKTKKITNLEDTKPSKQQLLSKCTTNASDEDFYVLRKGRLYPAFSLSGSEGEAESSPFHHRSLQRRRNNQHTYQEPSYHQGNHVDQQHTYQQPFCSPPPSQQQQNQIGYSDNSTSDNASDATLTDSELVLARDSTLVVRNGKFRDVVPEP
ncbi:hypothetical protein RUM44_008118 [Polyplax serrata]|uniref:Uncharacterized protein n=1 Tax=Polyplax serrata TaxID=468196 RepID=A0ABR1B7Q5_POLSC